MFICVYLGLAAADCSVSPQRRDEAPFSCWGLTGLFSPRVTLADVQLLLRQTRSHACRPVSPEPALTHEQAQLSRPLHPVPSYRRRPTMLARLRRTPTTRHVGRKGTPHLFRSHTSGHESEPARLEPTRSSGVEQSNFQGTPTLTPKTIPDADAFVQLFFKKVRFYL